LLGLVSCQIGFSQSRDSRPNVIYILADDLGYGEVGYNGHPVVQTPNIDRLAENGTVFDKMYVNTATCWISRATIFTGMYLRGRRYGTGAGGPLDKRWSAVSYPRLLKDNGYKVGYFGKSHVKFAEGEQEKMFDQFKKIGRNPYFKKQKDGSLRHETELIGDEAEAFIDSAPKDKPFMLNLCFNAAHAEDSDKENHYPHPYATYKLSGKQTFNQESIRIPFIVMDKGGKQKAGTVDDKHLISNGLDLLPTVLDYAGVPDAKGDSRGLSVRPLVEGKEVNTDICPTGRRSLTCFTLVGASHQLRRFIALEPKDELEGRSIW